MIGKSLKICFYFLENLGDRVGVLGLVLVLLIGILSYRGLNEIKFIFFLWMRY